MSIAAEGTDVRREPASRELTAPIADDAFYRGDPFPHYARMRAEAPVVWSPDGGYWVVSTNAEVVAVRVLDRRGSGSNADVIAGVNYVASVGKAGDVANMSLGGGVSQALDDAVRAAAGVVKFALAAGNESESAMNHSPARAGGVSATDNVYTCLLYTSPSPRDGLLSRMPSSA